ncbi:cytochrome P450 [Aspergillus heteromorphus CBS 117.55]|uniref:Cytochrome P450 n=1 Tax=Aspergillus heteromorphus CBS 117.55 TaxID=1448321 RepID=A0A317VZM4_9EURO|nr:cytochrome P450 [Aspergillus heteromorphus CBS 117.55]PWY79693.1 cytochrome P450 [Aspergillus heteromorphus CBS 117.55]
MEQVSPYLTATNLVGTLLVRLFSPIQRLPGSLLHKFTSLPLKIAIARGESHYFTVNLHRQYGPIVALSPTMISVSDSHEVKRIIHTEDWPKSEAVYGNFRQDPKRPTLIAFSDKKAYSHRKRLVSSMFGIRYIRSMQPLMLDCISVAVTELERRCRSAPSGTVEVDMQHMIQALAADIIGVTTFGQTFDVVKNGSHPLPDRLKMALKLSGILQFMPWLSRIPFIPQRDTYVDSFTAEIVANRRAAMSSQPPREDLLQKLVEAASDGDDDTSPFRSSDVQDEVVILLIAGSETTSNAELFTLIMLLKNPSKLATLYKEIDHWYPRHDPRPTDCEYSFAGMTYLQACIDETMRLVPGQATGSPRESFNDETILGYAIPKRTTVFPTTQQVHLDERLWANAAEFIPERWLDVYTQGKQNDMPYWPFSAGSRVCIGKHFAWQEMHLSLVSLLRRFRFEYVRGQDEATVFRIAQQMRGKEYRMKISLR